MPAYSGSEASKASRLTQAAPENRGRRAKKRPRFPWARLLQGVSRLILTTIPTEDAVIALISKMSKQGLREVKHLPKGTQPVCWLTFIESLLFAGHRFSCFTHGDLFDPHNNPRGTQHRLGCAGRSPKSQELM